MDIVSEKRTENYSIKFTATEEGQVLGWVFLFVLFESRHKEPYGLMGNLYVEIEHRGRGLGTQLINKVIEEAKTRECYKLICNAEADRAISLYERLGFKKTGTELRMDLMQSNILQRD